MAVKESRSNGQEIGVARVVDLDNTPRVLASAGLAAANLDDILRANNGKGHEASQLGILLNRILVVLFDIIREVVNGDPVVLNVLHNQLLGLGKLGGGQRVGAPDDGNDVDARSEALHELNVKFSQTAELGVSNNEHVLVERYVCLAMLTRGRSG